MYLKEINVGKLTGKAEICTHFFCQLSSRKKICSHSSLLTRAAPSSKLLGLETAIERWAVLYQKNKFWMERPKYVRQTLGGALGPILVILGTLLAQGFIFRPLERPNLQTSKSSRKFTKRAKNGRTKEGIFWAKFGQNCPNCAKKTLNMSHKSLTNKNKLF